MKYLILIERPAFTEYWSQYGGFTPRREDAREYSEGAADMQLRNLHGIAKYGAEHKDWIRAKKVPILVEEFITN